MEKKLYINSDDPYQKLMNWGQKNNTKAILIINAGSLKEILHYAEHEHFSKPLYIENNIYEITSRDYTIMIRYQNIEQSNVYILSRIVKDGEALYLLPKEDIEDVWRTSDEENCKVN